MRSGSLCALLGRLLSWCQSRQIVLRARHIPGRLNVIEDKLSLHNQIIQMDWSLSQQVFNHLCSRWGRPQTGLRPNCLGRRLPEPTVGESKRLCVSSCLPTQPSDLKSDGSGLPQNDSDCTGLAEHALVLGPSANVSAGPLQSSSKEGPGDSTLQRPGPQESQQPESACVAPRASIIQKQGFSEEVAARIGAPQRLSTRALYKSSGPFLSDGVKITRWTSSRPL